VARTLGRCIVEEILARSWTSESVPDDRDRNEWLGAIPEDHLTAHVLAWFLTKGVPFDRAVDAQRHQAELAAKLQNFMDALTADEQRRLFGLAHQTKINDLVDGLGRSLLKDRQAASALEYFQLGERRRPWMPNSHVFAAMCLMQLGKKQEAIAALNRADQACLPPVATLRRVRDEVAAELGPIPAD
jgi:tetratricopeptide (TPR) repeat protein